MRTFPLAVATAALTLLACSDDGGIKGTATGDISVNPGSFTFPKVGLNDAETRQVVVSNPGAGALFIRRIRYEVGGVEGEFKLEVQHGGETYCAGGCPDGAAAPAYPLRVEPGTQFELLLTYSPRDESFNDEGRVVLETSLSEGDFPIPVRIADVNAEISCSPRALEFGRVVAGDEDVQEIKCSNIGQLDLSIRRIDLNGSQDFTPLIDGRDPRLQRAILDDPDGDGKVGLGPGREFVIAVRYRPPVEGPDTGELTIYSDDPNRPEVRIGLRANSETPCLDVTPPALEYRASLVNRTDSRQLTIESCGGAALEVTRIVLSDDSDPAFAIVADSLPEIPLEMPAVAPGSIPTQGFRVSFSPREQRIHHGKLLIESNDPVTPVREVALLGRGVVNECPVARAVQDEFTVLPLDIVTLDGSLSIDPDGPNNAPVEYEWVIISSPAGSASTPVGSFYDQSNPADGGPNPEPTSPVALFFVDEPGTYVLELRVRDNLGLDSVACGNAATIVINAVPETAIHIQLTWATPADEDPTDGHGPDLDLHLLHPFADDWFTTPYDCYFLNPIPDWGEPGDKEDDCFLDIDRTNGNGPENISLRRPENTDVLGSPYIVGVHYYSSIDRRNGIDYGPSDARVRIFINGQLDWDFTDGDNPGTRAMEQTGDFWDVAQIHWPPREEGTVETRDRYFQQ